MEQLVDDLLTMARSGQEVRDVGAVDLGRTTEGCWVNVATADATLRVAGAPTIRADQARLQQLLENVFRNAVEHAGGDVTVTVGALADGVYVADDGPGIPPGDRDVVFEGGFTTAQESTGLGLAIVAEVAGAHGWTVTATESADGGARFAFGDVDVVDASD